MGQDAGERGGKAEAIREHVFIAGLAEVFPVVVIAIEDLAEDALGARQVDVSFFDRRAGWKPAAFGHVLCHAGVVVGVVLLHQAVAIGAGPVKNVVWVFIDVLEIDAESFQEIFADGLRHLPAPLSVEMRVRNDVERRRLGDIRSLAGLGPACAGETHRGGAKAKTDEAVAMLACGPTSRTFAIHA